MDFSYFDQYTDRTETSGSYSTKWQAMQGRFPGLDPEGVLPMWIADMDFLCPPQVIEAVKERAAHGIYGYTSAGLVRSFIEAAAAWMTRRYGWEVDPDWGFFTPGVIPVLNSAVQEFTEPGDGVIIQPPVYYPFADGIRNTGRAIRYNQLIEKEPGYYVMDYASLEELASDPKTKLMIISNPHNPVGRAWSAEELRTLCEICIRNHVLIVSDEIHGDLMMDGHKHIPTASLSPEIARHVITAYAPSKTFNLAGLGASVSLVVDPDIRERIKKRVLANRYPNANVFGPLAGEVAFRTGDEYVDTLVSYVSANMDAVIAFCKENTPKIRIRKAEGTYMIWVDLRQLNLGTEGANAFMLEKARIAGDLGPWFGPGGEGFVRLNLACPRKIVEQAMVQLKTAYDQLEKR
jgi:cystathionine beta-lyase